MLLQDACDETPQAEQLLELCRQDVEEIRTFGTKFHSSCSKTMEGLTTMIHGLRDMLQVSKQVHSRFTRDDEPNVSFLQAQVGLQTMIVQLGEICGIMHNFSNELANNMMYPIDRFIRAELEALDHRSALHCASNEQYKETSEEYSRLSQRKVDARSRAEQLKSLKSAREQARENTLHYFAALQTLKLKRSYLFLEPLLGYLRAFMNATRASTGAIEKQDFETNLTVFDAFVKSEHRDLTADQRRLEAQIDSMSSQRQTEATIARSGSPGGHTTDASDENSQVNAAANDRNQLHLHRIPNQLSLQKSGYLYSRRPPVSDFTPVKSGVASFLTGVAGRRETPTGIWERVFVFIQGGNLMVQAHQDLAGSSVADLLDTSGIVHAEPAVVDDRFGTFLVTFIPLPSASPGNGRVEKKTIACFQCESDVNRDEWIRLINLNADVASDSRSASISGSAGGTPRAHSIARSESPSHSLRGHAASLSNQPSAEVSPSKLAASSATSQPLDLDTALEFVPIQFDLTDASKLTESESSSSHTVRPAPTDANSALGNLVLHALASSNEQVKPLVLGVNTNTHAEADTNTTANESQSLANEIAVAESSNEKAAPIITEASGELSTLPQFYKCFAVRFVGSMQIGAEVLHASTSREELVSTAVRKMLLARVTHDVMRMLDLSLVICEHCIALLDSPAQQRVRTVFDLQHIVQLAFHRDNPHYVGFILRRDSQGVAADYESEHFECFAFECDEGGASVYEAFKTASRVAFQASLNTKPSVKDVPTST